MALVELLASAGALFVGALTLLGEIIGGIVGFAFKNPLIAYLMFLGYTAFDVFLSTEGIFGFQFSLLNTLLNLFLVPFGFEQGNWNVVVFAGLVLLGGLHTMMTLKKKGELI